MASNTNIRLPINKMIPNKASIARTPIIKPVVKIPTATNRNIPKKASLSDVKANKRLVKQPEPVDNSDASEIEVEFDVDDADDADDADNKFVDIDKQLIKSQEELLQDIEFSTSATNTMSSNTTSANINLKKLTGGNARLRAVMARDDSDDPDDLDNTLDGDDLDGDDLDGDDADDLPVKPTGKPRKLSRSTSKLISKPAKPVVKRGPGRPRKTQKKEPIPRKGISKNPQNPDSFVEFLYDQPIVMKKIFSFFKALAATEIQILFRPKDIIFYAIDHHDKTKIRIKIDASKINHYYCRSVLDIGISQKEMEMILNKVDKDYTSIVVLSEIESNQKNLTVVFENDIQIDELHRIDLIATYGKLENEQEFIEEDYTVKFQLPSKYFKKMINDIKSISSQLSITQEDNESPLVFEYIAANSKLQSKHTVKNSDKIKLESNLSDHDSFRVDLLIDYIKPISALQIADEIYILVDENKLFMTKAYVDNGAVEIKTLTEIIDERPDDGVDPDD